MKLYTINNSIYPDVDFNFSLTVVNLELAPLNHTHSISDVIGLEDALALKSDIGHSHEGVQMIYVGTPSTHYKTISMSIGLTDTNHPSAEPIIRVSDSMISLDYSSLQTGIIDGINNTNTSENDSIVRINSDDSKTLDSPYESVIIFEENQDA